MIEDKTLESWDAFTGNYLTADKVESENDPFVVINVESKTDDRDDVLKLRLTLEKNEVSLIYDLNKTNANKLKEIGIKTPRQLISKKLYFKKVLVRNPQTNKEVESLRIWKSE
jgi:hypothetical protein